MIGAAVYRLRAQNSAWLPMVHGRLLHAAFFAALQDISPELSGFVHDQMNIKPFTVSELMPWKQTLRRQGSGWNIAAGTRLDWRVTGLNDVMLQAIAAIRPNHSFRVGRLLLVVEKLMMDPAEHPDSGILDENELIAACLQEPQIDEITFRFLSPVSFRADDHDYPWPLPEYVFASLADKWRQAGLPGDFDKNTIREEAAVVRPLTWQGESRKVYFTRERGILAFIGRFTYDLRELAPERQQMFLLLAQFAVFSGVGRMTGQGLGQTRVIYERG